jgi:hypothetical protein
MANPGERRLEDLDRLIQECTVINGWLYPLPPFARWRARRRRAAAEKERAALRAWMRDPYYHSVDPVHMVDLRYPKPMPV